MPNLRWHLLLPLACLVIALFAGAAVADTTYVVQPGDTLTHLAQRFDTTVHALVVANEIVNPDLIRVGQVLTIPDNGVSSTYVVRLGDVLSELAARSGVSMERIAAANEISNVDLIYAGQALVIPDGFIPPSAPTHTPQPTLMPTARPTPTPTPLPTATPALTTIEVDNAERVRQVGRIGQGTIQEGALSPDGRTLALSGSLGVWLYDYASLAFLDFFELPEGNGRTVSWSPDGGRLVVGLSGRGTGAQVWDVVQAFTAEGQLLLVWGKPGDEPQSMGMPAGLVIDKSSLAAFDRFVSPNFEPEYLLFVVNQFGGHKIAVYAYGQSKALTAEQYEIDEAKVEQAVGRLKAKFQDEAKAEADQPDAGADHNAGGEKAD